MVKIYDNYKKMFKEYNQNQSFLLPPNFKEYLWESHESVILNEIINDLNLDNLYNEYRDLCKIT